MSLDDSTANVASPPRTSRSRLWPTRSRSPTTAPASSTRFPITDGAIRATDLRQIKTGAGRFGLMTYDPAFMNTAACRSRITYIDGDKGILEYRGYPIEQLAGAFDVPRDGVPDHLRRAADRDAAQGRGPSRSPLHTMLHENIKKLMEGFQYDAHPMGIFLSTVGAFSTFYPDAKQIFDEQSRKKQMHRLIAKVPTHRRLRLPPQHRPPVRLSRQRPELHRQLPEHAVPDDGAEVPGRTRCSSARSTCCSSCTPTTSRTAARARCAASAARTSIRTRRWPARPRRSTVRCTAAPTKRCCGCSRRSARCSNIPGFIKRVKAGEGRLMGFGHRVYKSVRPARQDHQAEPPTRCSR